MFTTKVMADNHQQKTLTDAERLALIYKPFPVIRVHPTLGHSQAPNWVKDLTLRQEDGPR